MFGNFETSDSSDVSEGTIKKIIALIYLNNITRVDGEDLLSRDLLTLKGAET